jgi:hypothetical protein
MTPSGFLTVPEALEIIASRIDDDDYLILHTRKPDRETAACFSLGRRLSWFKTPSMYVMVGGAPEKINNENMFENVGGHPEDIWIISEIMEGWETWLPSGRVANKTPYNGCPLLIRQSELEEWLTGTGAAEEPRRSGAPGKPSSMHLILGEHERRHAAGKTAQSRGKEGEALVAWLRATHPSAPPVSAKRIRDRLPRSFQPFNGRLPK